MTAEGIGHITLTDALLGSAERYADESAIFYRDMAVSYGELAESAGRLATGLEKLGIERGDRVALVLPNCPQFIVSYFAVTGLGAVCVPCNVLLKPDELAYIFGNAGIRAVITVGQLVPALAELKKHLSDLEYIIGIEPEAVGDALSMQSLMRSSGADIRRAMPEDTAAIIYTSGTTGKPKGAVLTHGNLVWDAAACLKVVDFTQKENLVCAVPLFHSFAATVCMVVPMLAGAKVTLIEKFMPDMVLDTIKHRRVTVFIGVPTMYAALLQYATSKDCDISSLWLGISGGAPIPPSLQEAAQRALGITILEGYGLTECSPVVCLNPPDKCKIGSVGPALPGVEVRVCGGDGSPLPRGSVGEVEVRGGNVMKGYLGMSGETAEVLRDGWIRTGDLGRLDEDGYLYIVDRSKDMIIVGGLNVYPREVEDVLYTHPNIAECAVVGVQDGLRGEIPKAFVVLKSGEGITEQEIVRYCRERIANYKVPRSVEFRESLPKSSTGKILKRALQEKKLKH